MTQSFDADVIIAGAGMAGATLALALASGGLKPVLIEAARRASTWISHIEADLQQVR